MKTKFFHVEQSISGYYRLKLLDVLIVDDSATEEVNGTKKEAEEYFDALYGEDSDNVTYSLVWDCFHPFSECCHTTFETKSQKEAISEYQRVIMMNKPNLISRTKMHIGQLDEDARDVYRLQLTAATKDYHGDDVVVVVSESAYYYMPNKTLEQENVMHSIGDRVRKLQALYPHCRYQFIKRTIKENSEDEAMAILEKREAQNLRNLSNERNVEQRRIERVIEAYEELKAKGCIEATLGNIKIVGEYLRTQNWGTWTLPAMSVGYSASQYDCGGKTVVGFIFDEPIEGHKRIAVGPARGYLEKYYHI